MAYVGSLNNVVTLGAADTLYAWKAALVAAGWQLLASSQGTALNYSSGPTPDQLTSPTEWNNANAWCRLQEPSPGTRQLILMRGSTATTALVKYSRQSGFTTGAAFNTCPTTGGNDGIVWLGTGTDTTAINGTFASTIAQTSGYVSFVASDTASANGVWGFWGFSYSAGTATMFRIIVNEPVAPASTIAASPPPGDNDPSWRYITNNMFGYDASQTPQFWQAYGLPGATYVTTSLGIPRYAYLDPSYTISVAAWSAVAGLNPYNQKVGMYPGMIGAAPPSNPKGFTSGVQMMAAVTNRLDTYNITTAEPRIVVQLGPSACQFCVPWVPNASPLY